GSLVFGLGLVAARFGHFLPHSFHLASLFFHLYIRRLRGAGSSARRAAKRPPADCESKGEGETGPYRTHGMDLLLKPSTPCARMFQKRATVERFNRPGRRVRRVSLRVAHPRLQQKTRL